MTPDAPLRHIPVLGREAVGMLAPRGGGIYVDATFGAGGYSRAILAAGNTRVIGIDRDRTAIAGGFDLVEKSDGRLTLVEDRFSNLAEVCAAQGADTVDGVVMDVGVSSMQLDEADRGGCRCQGVRSRSCQHHLYLRRGASLARRRPRYRRGAEGRADHDHAGIGRTRVARRPCKTT